MSEKIKTPKTYDEAVAALEDAKGRRKDANAAMDSFLEANSLKKKKDYSDDKTHGKEFKGLQKTLTSVREEVKNLEPLIKSLKPDTARVSKYEYPTDVVTEADKKKHRAKMRREAANEGKPAKEVKEKKAKKTEDAPADEAKAEKSDKKKKKNKDKKKDKSED